MKFKTYLGKPIEGAYENYLERAKEKKEPEEKESLLFIPANINRQDYIKIPNTDVVIARQETEKGKDWEATRYALADNGLFMPTISLFMPYYINVRDAAQGKATLYTADNKQIPRNEAEELWKYISTDYKRGCWTWLDAKFSQENNLWKITYDHKVAQKGKKLEGKTNNLEDCIRQDCFVNLEFNSQGLPIKKSSSNVYKQGENIYYYPPRNGAVARFWADSVWAYLSCYWGPQDSDASLGVFSCAEGTQKN